MTIPPDADAHELVNYPFRRGTCPRCSSPEIRHLAIGMPTGPDAMNETPEWVDWVGCCHPGHDRRCPNCGWTWNATIDENACMTMQVGDKISSKGRVLTVTDLDLTTLDKMRPYLIYTAAASTTVTYGELIDALNLPHVPNGLGRMLDLLSEDCIHNRNEPSLAALVVSQSTGEVGDSFDGDPVQERELLYAYWANAS